MVSALEKNITKLSLRDTRARINRRILQKQKEANRRKQQSDKVMEDKVSNTVRSAPPSSQKNAIEFPSINSKMNSLRDAMNRNNMNEKTSYKQSETKTSVKIDQHSPRINLKMKSLREAMNRNNKNEETPFKKSDGKTSVKKPQFSTAQNQKSNSLSPRISSKVDSLREAINNRNDMNENASYKKSGATKVKPNHLSTANASYKKSGKTSVKPNHLSTAQSQKSESPLPRQSSKVDSLREAIDNRNDMNKNVSYQKSHGKPRVKKTHLSKAQNQHSDSTSPRTRAKAQAAAHQSADFGVSHDISEPTDGDNMLQSTSAEIETTVPENLFGMWGNTVKAKKPTAEASMMSNRMIRNQADMIKQRINKARKEAAQAAGDHAEDGDDASDVGIKIDPDESASKLFFGSGKRNASEKSVGFGIDADESASKLFFGSGNRNASEKSVGIKIDADESASKLFFGSGNKNASEKSVSIKIDPDESASKIFYGKDNKDESDGKKSMNEAIDIDSTASFHDTRYGKHGNVKSISDILPPNSKASKDSKSWLDDTSSYTSSSDESVSMRIKKSLSASSPQTKKAGRGAQNISKSKSDDRPAYSRTSLGSTSWLDDSSSYSTSSDESLSVRRKKSASVNSPLVKKSRPGVAKKTIESKTKAVPSFDEDESFIASDFSDLEYRYRV
jgi:hypothetical protein